MQRDRHVFTIGHSSVSAEQFFELIERNGIEVLVDIRSHPYSKYASQFNKESLSAACKARGIKYLFLGRELGGQPDDQGCYDSAGHVLYSKIAQSRTFQEAIARVVRGAERYEVVLMCSEEDPTDCHRRLLVTRCLLQQSVTVCHIRGDGTRQSEAEIAGPEQQRLPLFADAEETEWKSTRSVLRKEQLPTSLEP